MFNDYCQKTIKICLSCLGILLLFCFCFFGKNYNYITFFDLFKNYNISDVCAVYDCDYNSIQVKAQATNIIKTANKSIVYFSSIEDCIDEYNASYLQLDLYCSEYLLEKYLSKFGANLIMEENIVDTKVCYYYLSMLSKFKFLKNKKVNLQVVFKNEKTTVGYPMVYVSF